MLAESAVISGFSRLVIGNYYQIKEFFVTIWSFFLDNHSVHCYRADMNAGKNQRPSCQYLNSGEKTAGR